MNYASLDESILSVDASGHVTALHTGTGMVRALLNTGDYALIAVEVTCDHDPHHPHRDPPPCWSRTALSPSPAMTAARCCPPRPSPPWATTIRTASAPSAARRTRITGLSSRRIPASPKAGAAGKSRRQDRRQRRAAVHGPDAAGPDRQCLGSAEKACPVNGKFFLYKRPRL